MTVDPTEYVIAAEAERVPTRLVRWTWTVTYIDGSGAGGWAMTRWGARRAMAAAQRNDRTWAPTHDDDVHDLP